MQTFTKTETRNNLSEIIKQVKYGKKIVAVKRDVLIVPFPEVNETIPISQINEQSGSFDFLDNEPDLYTLSDLQKRYV